MKQNKKKQRSKKSIEELRKKAQKILDDLNSKYNQTPDLDKEGLWEELNIYHIELEMQNDELENARDRLESSLKYQKTLFDHAPIGYVVMDTEGIILQANEYFTNLIGISKNILLGNRFHSFVPPSHYSIYHNCLKNLLKQNTPQRAEMILVATRKTKIWGWLDFSILEDPNQDSKQVLCSVVNITDEKRAKAELISLNEDLEKRVIERTWALQEANEGLEKEIREREAVEQELEKAKQAAETANQAKSEFLANMSHEIRTPLNVILGINELMLDADLSDTQRKHVNLVQKSSKSLLHLLDDILDFSKMEAGQLIIDYQPMNLQKMIEEAVEFFQSKAQKKGLDLRFRGSATKNYLLGDVNRLKQIFYNLIGNAIKFSERGTITITSEQMDETQQEIYYRFSIADTGRGIAQEFLSTLFERFSQQENALSKNMGGSGLGLAICKRLIELMNGKIWAESEMGKGTTFYFTCPLKKCTEKEYRNRWKNDTAKIVQGPLNVLVVEDDSMNQYLAKTLLLKKGHQVTIAENGTEALKKMTISDFHIILMDVKMPNMDGITATRWIRSCEQGIAKTKGELKELVDLLQQRIKNTKIPIIGLTAHAMAEHREQCLEAGMDDFITKPFKIKEFFSAINRTIAIRE